MTEHVDLLIIGSGAAGTSAAFAARQASPDMSVVIIGKDNRTEYSAPALPDYLSFNASVMGTEGAGPLRAEAELRNEKGVCVARATGAVAGKRLYGGFPAKVLKPGKYEVEVRLLGGDKVFSKVSRRVLIADGAAAAR